MGRHEIESKHQLMLQVPDQHMVPEHIVMSPLRIRGTHPFQHDTDAGGWKLNN